MVCDIRADKFCGRRYGVIEMSEQWRAQFGEDRLLVKHFGGKREGYFVEVGAFDGENLSNTYFLEKALGWQGILVEPIPKLAAQCRTKRPLSQVVEAACVGPGGPPEVLL